MSSVDLPLPDGPTRLSDCAGLDAETYPLENMDLSGPAPEPDMDVFAVDDWCGQIRHPILPSSTAGSPALASYGGASVPIQSICRVVAAFAILAGLGAAGAEARPLRIVALGDSLIAGYGLGQADTFTSRLQAALKARGEDVEIVNAGVSGDTASDGLARADWSIGDDADAVIVELGANDALRGIDPKVTRDALDRLLAGLRQAEAAGAPRRHARAAQHRPGLQRRL